MALSDLMTGEQQQQPQFQANPEIENIINSSKSEQEAMGKAYMLMAQRAMQRGLSDVATNHIKMAKMFGVGGEGVDTQIIEAPGPDGKMHKMLVRKSDGTPIKDYGANIESFKPKNLLGRGWNTKRAIMQSNEHGGRAIYEDSFDKGNVEFATPEDMSMLRPMSFRGLEAGQVDQLAGLKNTYDRLDRVIERVKKDPKAMAKFGPLAGNWNKLKMKFVNEGETQALQNELKSFITIAYGLSGKQISDSEMERLQDALLPHLAQPGDNFLSTAEFARDWVAQLHNDKMDYFDKAGYESKFDKLSPKGYTFDKKKEKENNGKVGRFTVTVE